MIILEVCDNGVGMSEEMLIKLNQPQSSPEQVYGHQTAGAVFSVSFSQGVNEQYKKKINSGGGVGVKNVQDRIRLYFGDAYGIVYESKSGEGTTATVKLPIVDEASLTVLEEKS